MVWTLCLAPLLSLSGCKTSSISSTNIIPFFHDELYPDYRDVDIETGEEVFSISDTTKTFVDEKLGHLKDPDIRIQTLADGIFDHSDQALLYQNDANTVAEETFNNRAANCLSLTIMSYALADYAGIGVNFQQVDIPELWVRRDGNTILNRHVNLLLYTKTPSNIILFQDKSYQLDFDRRPRVLRTPAKTINKRRVLAMFYNNKGADALINKNLAKAYAYFRSALTTDPLLIEAWTNMGLLYRRTGRLDFAENNYHQALAINKNDATTLENLAHIYKITDRQTEADKILTKLKDQRRKNPYYHFLLGEVEYDKQNWQQAIKHYRKSIRLNKSHHRFYFSLAKSYYQLGDFENSKIYMSMAKKYSPVEDLQSLYQRKLDKLSSL